MTDPEENFPLPRLNQRLELNKGPVNHDGSPSYTLYSPVSNKYYKLDWAEFECLSRFQICESAEELREIIENETPLDISLEDIRALVDFALENGLTELSDQRAFGKLSRPETKKGGSKGQKWTSNFQKLVFLRFPVFEPEEFLEKLYPYLSSFFTRRFLVLSAFVFVSGLILVLQKPEEFANTFVYMFSASGIITTLLVFALIKIIHEFAHAFTAHKFGVEVPHMGVAFIIFYPVLYTETTAAWRLHERGQRIAIGMAGVLAEMTLAGLFFYVWYFTPDGLMRSLAFTVIVISLVNSILINLNPLMKFDGYYVLSDVLGMDNLHSRALAFARWRIRSTLFNWNAKPPETLLKKEMRFLVFFGTALIIYRFFLFLIIGLALYMIFPKPFGLILFLLEIGIFLLRPLWHELVIWWTHRQEIISQKRGRITTVVVAIFFIFLILPVHGEIQAPAVMTYKDYRVIYPPASARIEQILVQDGQQVKKDEVLARLHSQELSLEIEKAEMRLKKAQGQKRLGYILKDQEDVNNVALDQRIVQARESLNQLRKQKENLVIKAPFDGLVRDLPADMHDGRHINPSQEMMRIVSPGQSVLYAFIDESELSRVRPQDSGGFYKNSAFTRFLEARVSDISQTDLEDMRWVSLASVYGGPVATKEFEKPGNNKSLQPISALYKVTLLPDSDPFINKRAFNRRSVSHVITGYVRIEGRNASYLSLFFNKLMNLWAKEPVLY